MTNYFSNYQPYNPYNNYMPPAMNIAAQQHMQPNNVQISFTNGLTGAKGYSVPPNTTIFLMDSDAPQFYIKQSDRNGMCTIKAYKFEEIAENEATKQQEVFDTAKYVTKEELSTIIQELTAALTPKAEPIKSLL
jgi:hypothetical protein